MTTDLILNYLNGTATAKERETLINWVAASDENKHEFELAKYIWFKSSSLGQSIQEFETESEWKRFEAEFLQLSGRDVFKKKLLMLSRVAAVLFFCMALGATLYHYIAPLQQVTVSSDAWQIEVPYGSKSRVVMPDGTEAWLNAGTHLTFTQHKGQRLVELKGEGYFEVAKDENRQFVVRTDRLDIIALGTIFNVKAYPDEGEIITTLLEGSVLLSENLSTGKAGNEIIMKPNENFAYRWTNDETAFFVKKEVNTDNYTSWIDNIWIIKDEPLPVFAKKLERRYNVKFEFNDNLEQYRLTAKLRDETLDQFLQALRHIVPIWYKVENGTVVLGEDKNLKGKYFQADRN
jgi:transmembrane sensor